MARKPGRTLDRSQINRRQKHELDYRASKWSCPKLAVIMADMLEHATRGSTGHDTAANFVSQAKADLRRANRAARKGKK